MRNIKEYIYEAIEKEAEKKAQEEQAKLEAEEKAKLEREQNPTVEDLLKQIKEILQNK
jgi:hypothetical protein